jgi:hypothetical protein
LQVLDVQLGRHLQRNWDGTCNTCNASDLAALQEALQVPSQLYSQLVFSSCK